METKKVNQSDLYPLYNQYWTVSSDLCVFVVCQFSVMSWIEVMDSLLGVSRSMLGGNFLF